MNRAPQARSFVPALCGLLFVMAACSSPPKPEQHPAAAGSSGAAPLEAVDPLPKPSPAALIAGVSPLGTAESGAQIRVRFSEDVVPLEALEGAATTAALSHFEIVPKLPGRFVVWTPRMIGFAGDAPLPPATRVRVTVKRGLRALSGRALDVDYAWTFQTGGLGLSIALPATDAKLDQLPAGGLQPSIDVTASTMVKPDSLAAHAVFHAPSGDVGGVVSAATPQPIAGEPGSAVADGFKYQVSPARPLARGTLYSLRIAAGVEPAIGNLPSAEGVAGALRTYGDFTLNGVAREAGGRFQGGDPVLTFSNPVASLPAAADVAIQPSPIAVPVTFAVSAGEIAINPYALAPRTEYTVTIAGSVKDAFGQSLGKPVSATFSTGDLASNLWAPSGFRIFPTGAAVSLNVETTNLSGDRYRARFRKLDARDLIAHSPDDDALIGASASWPQVQAPAKRNETVVTPVALRDKLGGSTGLFAYGVYGVTGSYVDGNGKTQASGTQATGAVQVTGIGLSVSQFPGTLIVHAAQLSDGAPIPGARIEVYPSLRDALLMRGPNAPAPDLPGPCATATAGAAGEAELRGPDFAACAASATADGQAPPLLVVVRRDGDWAFARTSAWGDYYDGVSTGWSAGAPIPHGALIGDRDLYQPGETARFAAIAYFDENGVLGKARASSFAVKLTDPDGRKRSLGSFTPDRYGEFAFEVPIESGAPLGYYTLQASAAGGEEVSGSFRVAKFKPPNFNVKLTLSSARAVAGETVKASSAGSYLFGAPLSGARQTWFVTRAPAVFSPSGFERFGFGRLWIEPEDRPTVDSDVVQSPVTLDAAGAATLDVRVDSAIPYPLTYTVEAQATDASNAAVSGTQTFTALPAPIMPGISVPYVASAGTPFTAQIVAVDPSGKAVPQKLSILLQQRVHDSATRIVEGGEQADNAVHYVTVATVDAQTTGTPAAVNLTAPKAGEYRVRVRAADAKDDRAAGDAYVWVTGPGETDWGAPEPDRVSVKLDKQKYKAGETAVALVESPYANARAYFAVVRHGVIAREARDVSGGAPVFRFTVTPEMLPNAAVQVVLVRRGEPIREGAGDERLARVGLAGFDVALDAKYLEVGVTPAQGSVLPGKSQTVKLRLRDRAGKPVSGRLTVAVVNESVLQLTGYRFPDMVSIVYGDQPISLRYADNRSDVSLVTQHDTEAKGFGYGGGMMGALASTRVRANFKALAYFNAAVPAGSDGEAAITFTLPDDLTTWRVLVLGLTEDGRFGTADGTFTASKPLVTNPVLPLFARPGDRFDGGVSVTSAHGAKGDLALGAALGPGLAFAGEGLSGAGGSLTRALTDPTQAFRFPIEVTGAGTPSFEFRSGLGGDTDAFRVNLPIVTASTTESVVITGTTQTKANVPLSIDPAAPKNVGGLNVALSSTLLPSLDAAIASAQTGGDPFLYPIAARVSALSSAVLLDRIYRRDPSSHAAALRTALDPLRALRLPNGSFALWPQAERGDVFSTAFAATALGEARDAGADTAADLKAVRPYLEGALADPGCKDEVCKTSRRLEALETLIFLGEKRDDRLTDIYAARGRLSYYEQVELARAMVQLPAWRERGLLLRDTLLQQVYETGRAAAVNLPGPGFESRADGQAQIVRLMIDTSMPREAVDKAAASLLAMRSNGSWGCPCDTAEALSALRAYAALAPEPPSFDASAAIGSNHVKASFRGYASTLAGRTIPAQALPAGPSSIAFAKSGSGTLHYAATYTYGVPLPAPGQYHGIRIDRIVRAAGNPGVLLDFGIGAPPLKAALPAAGVYEIEDRIATDHPLDGVVIEDPLPAGMEAIDATFRTAGTFYTATASNWEVDYQQIYPDHILAFATRLEAGVYGVHYLVRTVTPGTFSWPGARVSIQLAPDEFGRTSASTVSIR